jgi:hypothetical protein
MNLPHKIKVAETEQDNIYKSNYQPHKESFNKKKVVVFE